RKDWIVRGRRSGSSRGGAGSATGALTEVLPVPSRAVRGSRPQTGGCEPARSRRTVVPQRFFRQPSHRRLNQVGCPICYANVQESALHAEPIRRTTALRRALHQCLGIEHLAETSPSAAYCPKV